MINESIPFNIISIFPTTICEDFSISFNLIVNTNIGISQSNIFLYDLNDGSLKNINCVGDLLDQTRAVCSGKIDSGYYYITNNGGLYENVVIYTKFLLKVYYMPLIFSFYPVSISPSSNPQIIAMNFYNSIEIDYIDKIKFVGDKSIQANCEIKSNYSITCSAIFNDEGKYYLTINDVFYSKYIIHVISNEPKIFKILDIEPKIVTYIKMLNLNLLLKEKKILLYTCIFI